MSKSIMLIHGAWLTADAWSPFRQRYERAGYTVHTPAWPMLDRPIAELRRTPDASLGRLSIKAIADHYERLVRALPEPPILMGHSLGGLVVQLLLDRGLGSAGVAIDPSPAAGILPTPVALSSAAPFLLTWASWNRVMKMTPAQFARNFANTLSQSQALAAYERHVIPAPGRIYFEGAFSVGNRIDWGNARRSPLLLIAGEKDRMVEASMVRATYQRYKRSNAITEFRQFAARSHWICAEAGWEEVADIALDWAVGQLATVTSSSVSDKDKPFLQSGTMAIA